MTSIVVHRMPGNAYEHVTLNERQFPPFADVRVRRALHPSRSIASCSCRRSSTVSRRSCTGPSSRCRGRTPIGSRVIRSIRRARARCSTRPAGRPGPDGIRQRDGRPLAFTLITQAGFAIRENVAQAIQRQLRDVGVDVRVELHDGTAISALWFEGKFDAMLHWWQMPADPELTMFFAADRTPPAGTQHQLLQGRRADHAALRVGSHRRSRGAHAAAASRAGDGLRRSCRRFRSTTSRGSTPCRRRSSTSRAIRPTPGSSGTSTSGRSRIERRIG